MNAYVILAVDQALCLNFHINFPLATTLGKVILDMGVHICTSHISFDFHSIPVRKWYYTHFTCEEPTAEIKDN